MPETKPMTKPETEPEPGSSSIDLAAWRLLPWLANDTLEGEELERVLDQLKHSRRCREELLFLSELRHAVELSAEDRSEVPEARLTGLMERIDAHENAHGESSRQTNSQTYNQTRDSAPVGASAALRVLAQVALVVLLAGAVWWLAAGRPGPDEASPSPAADSRAPEYQTLSSDGASVAPTVRHRVRLIPADGLSEKELRGLVLGVGAEIVAGPTATGVYTLGWTDLDPRSTLDEVAASLRVDARVALAEKVRGP